MVAAFRGLATGRPDPVCDDPWAATLAGDEGLEIATKCTAANPHMELWLGVRTAFVDQQVRARAGLEQVVLLGAGLDTRAARLARGGTRFFEVDHPESQRLKRDRLATLDGYPVDAATYVACDFERDDFRERLAAEGFRADAPALFLWEGVVPYLSEGAVQATLERVASCHSRSVLLFDYVNKNMATGAKLRAMDARSRDLVADLGEPLIFGLNDPVPLLSKSGFRHVRTVSFDELCLSFTGTYERERGFRFQAVALASREQSLAP